MRYRKAPILEAVLEFRWSSSKTLDELKHVLSLSAFSGFEAPKKRIRIDAAVNLDQNAISHKQKEFGFEASARDGSQAVFLEEQKFVFVQRAPYDRWETYSARAMGLLREVTESLSIDEFSRVGLRFVNRIDIPSENGSTIDTDDYVTIKFDGPRHDRGVIEEFQMRVVKPTEKDGIHYALVVATTSSPLPNHSAILLDIDVFTRQPVVSDQKILSYTLGEMRIVKNEIFEECLTDKARALFGGVDE